MYSHYTKLPAQQKVSSLQSLYKNQWHIRLKQSTRISTQETIDRINYKISDTLYVKSEDKQLKGNRAHDVWNQETRVSNRERNEVRYENYIDKKVLYAIRFMVVKLVGKKRRISGHTSNRFMLFTSTYIRDMTYR